jgi:hypothetical protein
LLPTESLRYLAENALLHQRKDLCKRTQHIQVGISSRTYELSHVMHETAFNDNKYQVTSGKPLKYTKQTINYSANQTALPPHSLSLAIRALRYSARLSK